MIRMPRLTNYNWVVSIGLSVLFATLVTAGFAVADVSPGNVGYDNRFVFVRLKYEMPTGLQTGFFRQDIKWAHDYPRACLLYTSPSPRDGLLSRIPSSA